MDHNGHHLGQGRGLSPVEPRAIAESLQRAREDAYRWSRRERVVTFASVAALALASIRGVLALAAPAASPGGSTTTLAISLSLVIAASLVACAVGRRWAGRAARSREDVFWLEIVRDMLDAERAPRLVRRTGTVPRDDTAPVVVIRRSDLLRKETAGDGPTAEPTAEKDGESAGARSWPPALDVLAFVVIGLLLLVFAGRSPTLPPQRWTFTETGSLAELGLVAPLERAGEWVVEDHPHATGGRALVNHAGDPGEAPALAISNTVQARDVRASTRCKVRGAAACGLVFRFRDAANYHVAHVDAAAARVSLSAVVGGVQHPLHALPANVAVDVWQELRIEARAERVTVSWNGKEVIDARDLPPTDAGGVGLWAPADAVALFDELDVEPLAASLYSLEALPLLQGSTAARSAVQSAVHCAASPPCTRAKWMCSNSRRTSADV